MHKMKSTFDQTFIKMAQSLWTGWINFPLYKVSHSFSAPWGPAGRTYHPQSGRVLLLSTAFIHGGKTLLTFKPFRLKYILFLFIDLWASRDNCVYENLNVGDRTASDRSCFNTVSGSIFLLSTVKLWRWFQKRFTGVQKITQETQTYLPATLLVEFRAVWTTALWLTYKSEVYTFASIKIGGCFQTTSLKLSAFKKSTLSPTVSLCYLCFTVT